VTGASSHPGGPVTGQEWHYRAVTTSAGTSGAVTSGTGAPTVVHLVRHGEVENPRKILYGRLPGYRLSARGELMADRVRDYFAAAPVTRVVSSPMERAQQTAAPLAAKLQLTVDVDGRLIEAANDFEGTRFSAASLRSPKVLRRLYNPFRPSWGEPYVQIAQRMRAAITAARTARPGQVSVLVSHQLPIWIARLDAEGHRLWHDPRSRQCGLASVTSLHFAGDQLTQIVYAEPAADLTAGLSDVRGA